MDRSEKVKAARESWRSRLPTIILGLVFIFAGAIKVGFPLRFASDIANYKLISAQGAIALAFYLPWLEIICGGALLFRWLNVGALLLQSCLLTLFIGITIAAKIRGLDLTCGCFGHALSNLSFGWHLALDTLLLLVAVTLLLNQLRHQPGPSRLMVSA